MVSGTYLFLDILFKAFYSVFAIFLVGPNVFGVVHTYSDSNVFGCIRIRLLFSAKFPKNINLGCLGTSFEEKRYVPKSSKKDWIGMNLCQNAFQLIPDLQLAK